MKSLLALVLGATLAVACSDDQKQAAQDVSRALMVEKAEKIGEIAPSSVFPLGAPAQKWFALDVGSGRFAATPDHARTYLVELRGWLRNVNREGMGPPDDDSRAVVPGCNTTDPDWHYQLEIDTKWADGAGVDIGKLIRPGNVLAMGRDASGPLSRRVSTPLVHMEAIGMDPAKPGQSPSPAGWQTFGRCGDVTWAFDPLNPLNWQQPLAEGQYVRVFGAVVTDGPHSGEAWALSDLYRLTGIAIDDKAVMNGTMKRWAGGRAEDDPENSARWTEVHPPDIIAVLPATVPSETFWAVAVSAENCLLICDAESLDVEIRPPGPKPAGATVAFKEYVLVGTNFRTITKGNADKTGAEIVVGADKITVRVTVRGQEAYGAQGRFAAAYRVFWQPS